MTPLKITERKVQWQDEDPYDLFELAETPTEPTNRREFYGAVIVGALIASFISLATVWGFYRAEKAEDQQPFAYLEVKAIDPDGHPVVGALVRTDGESAGVTDTFGEWRRFMRVPLGGRIALTVIKKTSAGTMSRVKTLAIPEDMPASGDLEVVDRIQLDHLQVDLAKNTAPAAGDPVPDSDQVFADEPIEEAAIAETGPVEFGRKFDRIWVLADATASITSVEDEQRSAFLHKQVVASMRKRARQLGLAVDPMSPWRMTVRHVSLNGEEGLIQVTSTYHDDPQEPGERLYTFLSNYQEQAMTTARAIMYRISQHTPVELTAYRSGDQWFLQTPGSALWQKGAGTKYLTDDGRVLTLSGQTVGRDRQFQAGTIEPCYRQICRIRQAVVPQVAPRAGWNKINLQVHGARDREIQVYISGLAATHKAGTTYQYWGQAADGANVTVLAEGKVLHRGRVFASVEGKANLSLPALQVSSR